MKIIKIELIGGAIHVRLDNGEHATFHKFANTIYSTMSDGLFKKYFESFKRDIIKYDWSVDALIKEWIEK